MSGLEISELPARVSVNDLLNTYLHGESLNTYSSLPVTAFEELHLGSVGLDVLLLSPHFALQTLHLRFERLAGRTFRVKEQHPRQC